MGINLVTYYNSTVTPQDDALIYENALPASGMIYGGNVTIKNANTLHITAGHGALCGRKFTIEEADITVILTSSGTLNGRLYIHMDLSDTGSPISLEIERAASLTPVIQQSNVNINDGIYEINLATFQISTSTVSNLSYVAPFIKYEFAKEVIIAPVEKTSTASTNYAVGKHLIYNDILYRVTTAISSGGQINPGVNVVVSETIQNQIETNAGNISTANTNITNLSNNKANQTVIAPRQANATAATTYYAGDQFILNNVLYTATKTINSGTAINSGNSTASATIVSQISKFNQKQIGHAVGATSIPISNYHDVDVACIYTYNGTIYTWLYHIPYIFISQLGSHYRFLRTGDAQSIIILGITSSNVVINTATFAGTNVIANIDTYVYTT